jgi:8-oxo-dGTP pyrophosphatase MutT (NUDIX family)
MARRVAVRAYITRGNRMLLVQRNPGDIAGGRWQFVGGKTDNQPYQTALKREVKEETNLDVKNARFVKQLYAPTTRSNQRYYKVRAVGKVKLQASELQNYGWFTKEQALKKPLTQTSIKFIRNIRS